MLTNLSEVGRWMVVGLWVLEIVLLLSGQALVKPLMVVLLAVYSILIFASARPGTRKLCCALLITAALTCLYSGSPQGALDGLAFATAFPAFLATMALLRAAAIVHPTIVTIKDNLAQLRDVDRQSGFMIASHFLGAIVTAGTFGILSPLTPDHADETSRRHLAIACLRGVNLAVLWSPFFIGMAIVTHYLPNLPIWQLCLQGSLMALAAYALILLPGDADSRRGLIEALRQLMPIAPPVLILAILVVALSSISGLSALQAVFLIVPPIVALYLMFQPRSARDQAYRTCWQALNTIRDELLLVTTVGVLSLSLAQAPGTDTLVAWLLGWSMPPAILATLLLFLILSLAMIGVHPMAPASLILALMATDGPLSDLTLAAIGLLGWGLGTTVCPGSITVLIASNLFNVPASRLILSHNLVFVFGFGGLAVAASSLLTS